MSYTYLNQRMFGIKLFEHPTDLERLSPFFYTDQDIGEESIHKPIKESIQKIIPIPQKIPVPVSAPCVPPKKQSFNLPKDNLFWSIFISVYGSIEYKLIGSKFVNREWDEKNNIRTAFINKPKELQTTNQKVTLGNIKEMMSEYMTGGKTTLLGLVGMSVYYKVPIYLFDKVKKTHLSFIPQLIDRDACILFKTQKGYELYTGDDTVETLCECSFSLESYQKPLRAISNYKRSELDTLASDHGLTFCDKTKDEVYRALSQHLVWE